MTHSEISNHMNNADLVIFIGDDYGTLEFCYSFKIPDGSNELVVYVPDSQIDNFLKCYPNAY